MGVANPASGIRRQAPCDGCVHAKVCRWQELSCDAYYRFINGRDWKKATRQPTVKATRLAAAADRKEIRQDAREDARLGRRIASESGERASTV
jgi:hypothetical protein